MPVGMSPCALKRSILSVSPSRKPRDARPSIVQERDARNVRGAAPRRRDAMVAVGYQQRGGGCADQQQTERETTQRVSQRWKYL
jgi:hypothetical protein